MTYLQHARRHLPGGSDELLLSMAEVAHLEFFGTPLSLAAAGGGVSEKNIPWLTFSTTDPAVFGTNLLGIASPFRNLTADTTLVLNGSGSYLAIGSSVWDNGAYAYKAFVDIIASDADLTASAQNPVIEALTTNTFAGTAGALMPYSIQAAWVEPGDQGALRYVVQNFDSVGHDVASALLSVFYWPSTKSLASIY